MKTFSLFCIIIWFQSCIPVDSENFCPYTIQFSSAKHYLQVPIQIIPNQEVYQLGDTLTVYMNFNDSIHDLNTSQNFKIRNFPFKPILELVNFTPEGDFISRGISKDFVIIDSIYKPIYQSSIGNTMRYQQNNYDFEAKFILHKRGKFILQVHDLYQLNNAGGNPEEWNEYADSITFDGKCSHFSYYICNIIVGDDHIGLFEPELLYIDKQLSFDNYTTIKVKNAYETPFGRGTFKWEFVGTFGFEVK